MAMKITFYKSLLCPRCHAAGKNLRALVNQYQGVSLEEVDICIAPLRTWRDGIRMIPAIKVGEEVTSGLYLRKKDIANFLATVLHRDSPTIAPW